MENWQPSLRNLLLEWLCFYMDCGKTWHSLALVNKFCAQKCKEFSPMKKAEFSVKVSHFSENFLKNFKLQYLPGTHELVGPYVEFTGSRTITGYYLNGSSYFAFQNTEDGNVKFAIDVSHLKAFFFKGCIIFNGDSTLYCSKWGVGLFYSISCLFCSRHHSFSVLNLPGYENIQYSRNCLESEYSFKRGGLSPRRLRIARKVCDFALGDRNKRAKFI